MKNILFLWPMELPYDLTLHYHYTDFGETAAYLIKKGYKVDIFDGGVLSYLKKEYINKLLNNYDFLVIISYVHNTHSTLRSAELCKQISPNTKIIIFGPSCYYIPKIFEKKCIDGYVCDGDWEDSILSFIEFHLGYLDKDNVRGIAIKENNYGFRKGRWLNPDEWCLPPIDYLPVEDYNRIVFKKEFVKDEGIKQISLTVSRGCPYNCPFCKAPKVYGTKDRRVSVKKVLDFIEINVNKFDIFQLFSPTFNADNKWVKEFCNEILRRKLRFKWKCTSRYNLLTEEIVSSMSKAGCYMIGIGVESLNMKELKNINKIQNEDKILETLDLLRCYNIIPKAYIMLGIPGQTKESVIYTIQKLLDHGAKIRPSSYSPYQDLNKNSSLSEISKYNRYTLNIDNVLGMKKSDVLKLLFRRDFKDVYKI